MTSVLKMGAMLGFGFLVTACATLPEGPEVMVLPGTGKTFAQFQVDDATCRSWAERSTGITKQQAATRAGVGSAAVGTAVGAAAGAAIGAAAGAPATGAAVGAGSGLLIGSAQGVDQAWATESGLQRRYDIAYMQCMYANGNRIPVPGGSLQVYAPQAPSPPAALPPGVPPPPAGPPPPPPPGAS